MAFDFGFANSLMAKDDLAQRRADDQYNLNIAGALKQNQQNIADKNQAALSAIQDYYNTSNNETSTLLSQDAAKVNADEQALRKPVIDELGKYGNDPDMFVLNGGKALLDKYHNDFSNLPSLKAGLQNKQTGIKAVADLGAGKIWRMVTPAKNGVPLTNPDGTPLRTDVPTAWAMFNRGEIDKLPYEGAYDAPSINDEKYLSIPDPYKGKTQGYVPLKTIQQDLILHGGPKGTGMNPADVADFLTTHKGLLVNAKNNDLSTIHYGLDKDERPLPYQDTKEWWDKYGSAKFPDKDYSWVADQAAQLVSGKGNKPITYTNQANGKQFNGSEAPFLSGYQLNTGQKGKDGKDIYKAIEDVQTNTDGSYSVTYKEDPYRRYNDGKNWYQKKQTHHVDNLWSEIIVPAFNNEYGAKAADYLEKIKDHANKIGIAQEIGAPIEPSGNKSTEIPEFTTEEYKASGWSDEQIKQAADAGKIKVK